MSPTRDVVGTSDLDVFADTLADVMAGRCPQDELNRLPAAGSPVARRIRSAYEKTPATAPTARTAQEPPAPHGGPLPDPLPPQGETVIDQLDRLTVDWTDFEAAGEITRDLVQRLADDKESLRKLVYDVENKPELLAMCERHQLLDYIVLYDALDRGVRLRLHISTDDHFDRPHDHRFSFSSRIVTGGYTHTLYHMGDDIYGDGPDPEARQYLDRHHPDPRARGKLEKLTPHIVRWEAPGSCYTLHHSAIHTTFTTPDTVSLFLRGPAEKDRSVIMDKQEDTLWWRFGHQDEPEERRRQKVMGLDAYRQIRERLERLGVV